MKKDIDWRQRIAKALKGLPARGRPKGRRTGTTPSKHSIPQAWRDLDQACLEDALKELTDKDPDEQFVNCAARKAHVRERRGDYKTSKLVGKLTGPRRPRAHEQRVRQLAKTVLKEADRELLA